MDDEVLVNMDEELDKIAVYSISGVVYYDNKAGLRQHEEYKKHTYERLLYNYISANSKYAEEREFIHLLKSLVVKRIKVLTDKGIDFLFKEPYNYIGINPTKNKKKVQYWGYTLFLRYLDERLKSKKLNKEVLLFEDLFKIIENADRVTGILKTHGYIKEDGSWRNTTSVTEPICLYFALEEITLIKSGLKKTPARKTMYHKFKHAIPTDRTLNKNKPMRDELINEFVKILNPLNPKK